MDVGASSKKAAERPGYYQRLVKKCSTLSKNSFREIELDIDRTFGLSKTRVNCNEGKDSLRRILRAYSLRNRKVGYCQVSIIYTNCMV